MAEFGIGDSNGYVATVPAVPLVQGHGSLLTFETIGTTGPIGTLRFGD